MEDGWWYHVEKHGKLVISYFFFFTKNYPQERVPQVGTFCASLEGSENLCVLKFQGHEFCLLWYNQWHNLKYQRTLAFLGLSFFLSLEPSIYTCGNDLLSGHSFKYAFNMKWIER